MNRSAFFSVLFVLVIACKSKEAEGTNDASGFFPVRSYLQSQVRHVDTSIYRIMKISKVQGKADTAYLRREDFKAAAQDFLSLPDLASKKLRKKYAETKLYDEDLKKVVITYLPKDKEDYEQITREDVLIEPGTSGGNDKVATVYVETTESNRDSTIQKKMTWNVSGNFQVIKLINKQGQPEQVHTTDVTWTDGH
jgi:viroplasmin and RNaseH domain-containing protein